MIGIACLALLATPPADAPFQALVEREWERQLGPRFGVHAFHDEVLGAGSLPLDLLQARIDAWIARLR